MIFDDVKRIINEQLGINENEITMDSNFLEDFGADSLEIIDLMMAIESEYGLDVPEDEIEGMQTVGDAVKYISNHTDLD